MLPEAVAAFVPPSPAPSAPTTATPFHIEKVVSLQKVNRDASRVFAAYVSQGEESADFRGQGCVTEDQRSAFIKAARKRSKDIHSSLSVSRHDRLLTLVTCTGGTHDWYWVVHAVLAEEEEL